MRDVVRSLHLWCWGVGLRGVHNQYRTSWSYHGTHRRMFETYDTCRFCISINGQNLTFCFFAFFAFEKKGETRAIYTDSFGDEKCRPKLVFSPLLEFCGVHVLWEQKCQPKVRKKSVGAEIARSRQKYHVLFVENGQRRVPTKSERGETSANTRQIITPTHIGIPSPATQMRTIHDPRDR